MLSLLLQNLCRGLSIEEERFDLVNFVLGDFEFTKSASENHRGVNELHNISERGPGSDSSEMGKGIFFNFDIFSCASDSENLYDFFEGVRKKSDNQKTIKQIDGDAVRGAHFSSTDSADTSVGSQDNDRGEVTFEGSIHVGEALNVEHVDFINKQNTGNQLSDSVVNVSVYYFVDF